MEFVDPLYLVYTSSAQSLGGEASSSVMGTPTTASIETEPSATYIYASGQEVATPAMGDPAAETETSFDDPVNIVESLRVIDAKATPSSPASLATSAFASFIPASGFFATLMSGFRSSALPSPPVRIPVNGTDTPPDFVLKRLIRSLVSAVAQQSAESDIQDPKVSTFLSYLVSPFAVLCICMAILLDRTVVFATTRQPAPLTLPYRLILRSVAIYFLASRTFSLISAVKCTSSPLAEYVPAYFETETCPTPAVLWDLYLGICVGHFIETFSSVIQGQTPHSETGMTLFEYSMAFQEVQSTSQLSIEVLVVAITSSFSLLALHIFGAFNIYNYRLIPSTIFGSMFLTYFGWAVFNGRLSYFPTVCIFGYLPQLVLSMIIFMCAAIYGLAALMTGGSGNLMTSWKHVNISLKDDFYACLFKIGVVALTTTSQATLFNETALIQQPNYTWIERDEPDEIPETLPSNPKTFNSLLPSLLHASEAQTLPYSRSHRVQSPYNNETPLPPDLAEQRKKRRNDATKPPKLLTLYRITSVLKMIQGMVVIVIHLFLQITWNLGLKYLFRSRQSEKDTQKPIVTQQGLESVKNRIIYSPLENEANDSGYLSLLWGRLIPDIDNSEDYINDSEDGYSTDEEGLEYESDYEQGSSSTSSVNYVSHVTKQRQHFSNAPTSSNEKSKSTLTELFDLLMPTPQDLLALLSPQSPQEVENRRLLISHLEDKKDDEEVEPEQTVVRRRPITRSQFKLRTWDESKALLSIIEARRRKFVVDDEIRETLCVVCQSMPRQVILWPCRCLCVCEECRRALVTQNFKGCVCCRRDVKSFSRIYVP